MVSRSDTQSTFLSLASPVAGAGRARQDRIYRAGVSGLRPSVPTDAAGLEGAARRHMSRKAWAYVAGGAGEGRTMDANRESFYRHRLVPRMAHGVKERDLTVSLFGEDYASPVLLAPIGASALVDKDADLLTARAAAATGVPMVISNQGCSPLEDTAAAASLLSMARHHPGRTLRNLLSPEPRAAVETFPGTYSNPGLDWGMLATLRDRTSLPVVFKGILDPEDAERAFAVGADAVVVSNHGGRQVDGSVSSLDALIEIRRHLGDEPTLLLDSGIRTGRDVAVALALGADAVLLGRPWMYGLAVAGRRGAEEVIQNVLAELELTMALCGAKNVAGLRGTRVVGHA